jgi:hypothetical protein
MYYRHFVAVVLSGASAACGADCTLAEQPKFSFLVHSSSGVNLTPTAIFVIRRLEGSPPAVVDSVMGREFNVEMYQNRPGRYLISISHEGYVSQDRLITAVPDPWAGDCGPEVKHHLITVTLVPLMDAD